MKLLMYTQIMDRRNPIQGFTVKWVNVLSSHVDQLFVIANQVEECVVPSNVEVYSLGKEKGAARFQKLSRLATCTYHLLNNYEIDGIFVHQIEHYGLCAWPLSRLYGVPIVQFKAHKGVPWTLWIAGRLFNHFVTSTPGGLELDTENKSVIGQGIDTDRFRSSKREHSGTSFEIVSVGRISPVKKCEILVEAAHLLNQKDEFEQFRVCFVGGPGTREQKTYFETLKQSVNSKGLDEIVSFDGPIPHGEVHRFYQRANLFVNLSRTGSLDKAILEAMACECPIVTSNHAAREILPSNLAEKLMVPPDDPEALAKRVISVRNTSLDELRRMGKELREIVVQEHNLDRFMRRLVEVYDRLKI